MRFWRWSKRVLFAVIGTLMVTAIYLVVKREIDRSQGERELATAIAETDASEPRWRWDEIQADRFRPPEDHNSAPLIPKIKAAITPDAETRWRELAWIDLLDTPANVRLTESVLMKARECLAISGDAILQARALKDRPHGYRVLFLAQNPLETLLPDTQSARDVANVLRWNLWVSLENGDVTHAGDDLVAGLNASRSIGDEPFLISQRFRLDTRKVMLISLERTLAQLNRPSDLATLRLDVIHYALTRDAEEPLLLYGLRGDRAAFDVLLERLDQGSIDFGELGGSTHVSSSLNARANWWIYRARLAGDRAFCLRWMGMAVKASRLPIHEQPAAFVALPPIMKDTEHLMIGLLLPGVDKLAWAFWRNVAETRSAIAGVACERFRLNHNRWPNSLAELCPEFLAAVPLDPFDGQPLRYQKLSDGIMIYSSTQNMSTIPPHPGLPSGIEIGFRLWNPESRRLPPPPDPPKHGDDQ